MRIQALLTTVLLWAAPAFAELPGPLVSAGWLADHLGTPGLVVLDIRNRIDWGSRQAFEASHVPGAIYSNYLEDGWRVTRDGVIGMVPPTADLEKRIGRLGIDNRSEVVLVYGGVHSTDFGSAARIYWTFRYLGHSKVAILNGGWRAWIADPGRPIEKGWNEPRPARFEAHVQPELIADTPLVEAALEGEGTWLVDARPAPQYLGRKKHPAVRAYGHLPGAWSIPQDAFFDPETGGLRTRDELLKRIPPALLRFKGTLVSYCNTGHWAAIDWFVLHEILGREAVRLYDASMVGWTRRPDRPVETGAGIMSRVEGWAERYLRP